MVYKRLDRGTFRVPQARAGSGELVVEIEERALEDLLDGIDLEQSAPAQRRPCRQGRVRLEGGGRGRRPHGTSLGTVPVAVLPVSGGTLRVRVMLAGTARTVQLAGEGSHGTPAFLRSQKVPIGNTSQFLR
jgi:hypothetical protein